MHPATYSREIDWREKHEVDNEAKCIILRSFKIFNKRIDNEKNVNQCDSKRRVACSAS